VYHDALMRSLLVVQRGKTLWLVPRRPNGWRARLRMSLAAEARATRLTVAGDVSPEWLGVPGCPWTPHLDQRDTAAAGQEAVIGDGGEAPPIGTTAVEPATVR